MARTPLLLTLALLCACDRTSTAPGAKASDAATGETMVDGRCEIPFRCPGGPCLDYEADVKSLKDAVTLYCRYLTHCDVLAEVGRCGSARYTRYEDKYGTQIYWFDESGRAFALRRSSPYAIYCDGASKEGNYGPVPACKLEMKENLVPKHWD